MLLGTKMKKQLTVLALVVWSVMMVSLTVEAETADTLLADVVSLKLGMNGYLIGAQLDAAGKEIAAKHPVEGAYEGTYKFRDNDLYVVVDRRTDRILALYKQKKDVGKEDLKAMVVELMSRFNAPTTMAHDKILYWAFNKYGPVTEEDFNRAKKVKQTTGLDIIATVKLSSEMKISPDPEEGEDAAEKTETTGSVYFIITSDPLVKQFMAEQQQ